MDEKKMYNSIQIFFFSGVLVVFYLHFLYLNFYYLVTLAN